MGIQQLVTWDNQEECMKTQLYDMKAKNEFTDVTLVGNDQIKYYAHKVVLAAASSEFRNLFLGCNKSDSILYLRGFKDFVLKALLEFIYVGETKLSNNMIHEFLDAAKDLKIRGVEDVSNDDFLNSVKNVNKVEQQDFIIDNPSNEMQTVALENLTKKLIVNESQDDVDSSCKLNDTKFVADVASTRQIEVKMEERREKIYCDQCKYKTFKQRYLRDHKLKWHREKKLNCEFCDYKCATKFALSKHMVKKHRELINDELDFSCEKCTFKGRSKATLKLHMESFHLGIRYPCEYCNKLATDKSNLRKHYILKHGNEEPSFKFK